MKCNKDSKVVGMMKRTIVLVA